MSLLILFLKQWSFSFSYRFFLLEMTMHAHFDYLHILKASTNCFMICDLLYVYSFVILIIFYLGVGYAFKEKG